MPNKCLYYVGGFLNIVIVSWAQHPILFIKAPILGLRWLGLWGFGGFINYRFMV